MPHQCGDHYKCTHVRWCTYLKVKNLHPTWTDQEIAEEAVATSSRPHDGKNTSLSEEGIVKLTSKILSHFYNKIIDKIAGGGCSNLSENFWGISTKGSSGESTHFLKSPLMVVECPNQLKLLPILYSETLVEKKSWLPWLRGPQS